jgi:glycosyltransferase involved in cell wall biosynthesis
MIPYAIHQFYGSVKAGPQIYSFMHAQTPDPNDFTHPMRDWMRGMETGWAIAHNTVFCASKENIQQWNAAAMPSSKLFPVGISFRSDVVSEVGKVPCDVVSGLPLTPPRSKRKRSVVFSSRFDPEKNPDFFCDLVDQVMSERSDISFIVTSSAPTLRGRNHQLLSRLVATQVRYPENFEVRIGLTKEQYYQTLSSALVQFNCAHQDFISYTLIEATMCGCIPLYPDWLTFPGALNFAEENLYLFGTPEELRVPQKRAKSLVSAVEKLYAIVDSSNEAKDFGDYDYVWQKYNYTVHRMAARMSNTSHLVTSICELDALKSPDEVSALLQKVHNAPVREAR